MQEVLADLPTDARCYSTPAAAAQLRAALARLEGEQLRDADYPEHRSLEALRLEDPASMSGCWNPGCAAQSAMAGGGPLKCTDLQGLIQRPVGCAAFRYAVTCLRGSLPKYQAC